MRRSPKICAPNTAGVCPRPRLFARLEQGQTGQVTFLSAPAGAGKTTLVASFVEHQQRPMLWLTIDPDDTDPATFFTYFSRAVSAAKSRLTPPTYSPDYKDGLVAFARRYARQVFDKLPDDAVLVFDNLESVGEQSPIYDVIATFAKELEAAQHIVITSRLAPPSALSPLLVQGHMTVLGEADLRFSVDETQSLCDARAKEGAPSAEALTQWAQGWGAALVLGLENPHYVGASLPEDPTPQVVFDYFAAEVFSQLSGPEQMFLLSTSVFRRFTADIARRVCPDVAAADLLEQLVARNFFVVRLLEGKRARYAYHPLFRAFLARTCEQMLPWERYLDLHREAALALIDSGDFEPAIALLQTAEDWDTLDDLICAHAEQWLTQGWHNRVVSAATFPDGVDKSLELSFWRGTALLPTDPDAARAELVPALDGFIAAGDVERIYLCVAAVMESILYSWRSFSQLDHWMEMVELLLTKTRKPSFKTMGRIAGVMYSAQLFRRLGDDKAVRWEKEAKRFLMLARVLSPGDYILLVNSVLMHELFAGRLAKAKSLLDSVEGLRTSKRVDPIAQVAYYMMASGYAQFSGRWQDCVDAAEEGLRMAEECGVHFWDNILCAQGGSGALNLGRYDLAERYAEKLALGGPDDHFCRVFFEDIRTQLSLVAGDTHEAVAHARASVEHGRAFGSRYVEATMRVALAHTLSIDGQTDAAHAEMLRAEQDAVSCACPPLVARCALLEAEIAYARGYADVGDVALARGLAIAKECAVHTLPWWRPVQIAELCGRALSAGIEVEYVRELIAHQKLSAPAAYRPAWPAGVQIHCLGRFEVVIDGAPLRSKGKSQKRPLEMLAALIALGGHDVPEARLAEALWPDADGDQAQQSVKTTLHRLRKLIGPDVVRRHEGKLSLDEGVWVDALVARRAFESQSPADPPGPALLDALQLVQGPLLPDVEDVFMIGPRHQFQDAYCRSALFVARFWKDADPAAARVTLERAIERAPTNEGLYAGLIRLHQAAGRRAEAADVFRACAQALQTHFGETPSFDFDPEGSGSSPVAPA